MPRAIDSDELELVISNSVASFVDTVLHVWQTEPRADVRRGGEVRRKGEQDATIDAMSRSL